MKHEWKTQEKSLYRAKQTPAQITVPAQNYIMISGHGNPNDVDFSNRVAALYSLAYSIKMGYKKDASENSIHDFSVYPLEGVWEQKQDGPLVKESLEYTIMIRQPDFITEPMVSEALARVEKKKPSPLLTQIRFGAMEDGPCVEILHIGPFDDEPASFEKMNRFAENAGLTRRNACHREIYLNNAQRVPSSKLQTILRYQVL